MQRIAISLTGSLAAGDQAGGLASVPASAQDMIIRSGAPTA